MPSTGFQEAPAPEVVGLIPAAGKARRLGPLPCSKELLPLGVPGPGAPGGGGAVAVALDHLLARLGAAGVRRAYAVVDRGKADLLRHLAVPGRGASREPAVALLPVAASPSLPHSLDRAHPFLAPEPAPWVALGFPDVLFEPEDAFARLVEHRRETGAAVVLGLFPPRDPRTTDLVDAAPDGRVRRIEVRPAASDLRLNWLIALWDVRFTAFLHRWVAATGGAEGPEPELGSAFGAALAAGLEIQSVPFPEGRYLDLGTPEGYAMALGRGSGSGRLS